MLEHRSRRAQDLNECIEVPIVGVGASFLQLDLRDIAAQPLVLLLETHLGSEETANRLFVTRVTILGGNILIMMMTRE